MIAVVILHASAYTESVNKIPINTNAIKTSNCFILACILTFDNPFIALNFNAVTISNVQDYQQTIFSIRP